MLDLSQFIMLCFWDRCGCEPGAALGPAALRPPGHRQRELPGDARAAAAAGGGHAEAGLAGRARLGTPSAPWGDSGWLDGVLPSLGLEIAPSLTGTEKLLE